MKDTRRIFWTISVYNPIAVAEKLEEMAAEGWMFEKTGSMFWTFKKAEPKRLRFAVTYFPGASDFDPDLTEGEKIKAEYCAEDGWTLAGRFDIVHIYYSEDLDITPIDTEWSKEAKFQETFLLAYAEYEQNNIPNGKQTTDEAKDLQYSITDVKVPFLFDSIKHAVLDSRQDDKASGGEVVFVDHFEPIDPSLWGADEAYQLHWSDTVLDTYLVCWGNRIAEVKFFWGATEDEIRTAAEILKETEVPYEETVES